MKPRRMKQERAKRHASVEENLLVQATDDDNPQVKIDVEKALEEFRKLAEVKDEPPPEPVSTAETDAYIRSFFKKERR